MPNEVAKGMGALVAKFGRKDKHGWGKPSHDNVAHIPIQTRSNVVHTQFKRD